jgi:hypothetical protein
MELCTIASLFDKIKYKILHMGLKCSPDYAQAEIMENIFRDVGVADAEIYIDDISTFSHSQNDHIVLLHIILTTLQDNGVTVTVNPLKCE